MNGISFAYLKTCSGEQMKKLIFLITLSIIITYTFVTRAQATTRLVNLNPEITLDSDTQIITAEGVLPNPCTNNVQPSLTVIDEKTLQIEFTAQFKGPFCIMSLGKEYQVYVAPTTIQKELSDLGLSTTTDYEIVLNNGTSLGLLKLSNLEGLEAINVETFHSDIFPALKRNNELTDVELIKATD
jgi:hypothetical protein